MISSSDRVPQPRKTSLLVWAAPVSLAATSGITFLFSFPSGTKMVQFPEFASSTYVFSSGYLSVGFPIRTPPDQSLFGGSPRLFAAYHVLRRFSMPRHPLFALHSLVMILTSIFSFFFFSLVKKLKHSFRRAVSYHRDFGLSRNLERKKR